MSISEAFDLYRLDYIIYNNQSEKTLDAHNCALRFLLDFLGEDIQIEDLTLPQVKAWKRSLDDGRLVGTVREYLTRLRMVLKYQRIEGNNDVISFERITLPPRDDPDPQFLTVDQVEELIRVMFKPTRGYSKLNRYRNRALISLLFAAGLRSAEIRKMDRNSIRTDGTFTIKGKKKRKRLCFTDEATLIYIREYLAMRTDSNPALFIANQNGKRLSKNAFQRIFENARRKVDFDVFVHGHTLRHSFATDLLRNNANMRYVQAMLGHSSIQTTQIYTHVVDIDLEGAHKKHHTRLPLITNTF
jgi:site-specific recombinase XerD